jgi:hypothetical protein
LNEVLNPIDPAHVPAFLLNLSDAAYRAVCRISGFRGGHSRRQILLNLLFNVETQLSIEFLLHSFAAPQRSEPLW